MAEGMTGFAFGYGTEQRRRFRLAFDLGLLGEVQKPSACLTLAGERKAEVCLGL